MTNSALILATYHALKSHSDIAAETFRAEMRVNARDLLLDDNFEDALHDWVLYSIDQELEASCKIKQVERDMLHSSVDEIITEARESVEELGMNSHE
jgi:hypothetical protein